MPEVCRFLGIIIAMYYDDHDPAHFHVRYGEHEGKFAIMDLKLIEGKLPRRVISLVLEWAFEHRLELQQNWELLRKQKPINKIAPLE